MLHKTPSSQPIQCELFRTELARFINMNHPLVKLAKEIDWKSFEDALAPRFNDTKGRPSLPVRLAIGLLYLKYTFNVSDEEVVALWCENPYWQYFTGGVFFETRFPVDPSSLSRWRKRMEEEDMEKLLQASIKAGLKAGFIKPEAFESVSSDTTVQPKNIAYPTDSVLVRSMIKKLVFQAKAAKIELKRTFIRVSRKLVRKCSGYLHANQYNRAMKVIRQLRTMLRKIVEDIRLDKSEKSPAMEELLKVSDRLLKKDARGTEKVYSVHEPDVVCVCKGKAGKRYEYGCKVGFVATTEGNWITAAKSFTGLPYDGNLLKDCIEQSVRITNRQPKSIVCDLGYRKKGGHTDLAGVEIVNRFKTNVEPTTRKRWNRRSAIEPIIGHLKSDHRLARNFLSGTHGDMANALLAAAGFNLRKILRGYARLFLSFCREVLLQPLIRHILPLQQLRLETA